MPTRPIVRVCVCVPESVWIDSGFSLSSSQDALWPHPCPLVVAAPDRVILIASCTTTFKNITTDCSIHSSTHSPLLTRIVLQAYRLHITEVAMGKNNKLYLLTPK